MRSRKFQEVVATAVVEAGAEAAVEVREVMAARVAEAGVLAVEQAAVRARLRCLAVAVEEANDRAEVAAERAIELVWYRKVAADPVVSAERAIAPAGTRGRDPGEVRGVPPLYLETLAAVGPVAPLVDQAVTSGPHLEIDLEREVVIVRTLGTVRGLAAATSLGRVIDPGQVIVRDCAIVLTAVVVLELAIAIDREAAIVRAAGIDLESVIDLESEIVRAAETDRTDPAAVVLMVADDQVEIVLVVEIDPVGSGLALACLVAATGQGDPIDLAVETDQGDRNDQIDQGVATDLGDQIGLETVIDRTGEIVPAGVIGQAAIGQESPGRPVVETARRIGTGQSFDRVGHTDVGTMDAGGAGTTGGTAGGIAVAGP